MIPSFGRHASMLLVFCLIVKVSCYTTDQPQIMMFVRMERKVFLMLLGNPAQQCEALSKCVKCLGEASLQNALETAMKHLRSLI